jgi:hypothetical protein
MPHILAFLGELQALKQETPLLTRHLSPDNLDSRARLSQEISKPEVTRGRIIELFIDHSDAFDLDIVYND